MDLELDALRVAFYPDGTVCPGCQRETRFYRIHTRSAFGCQYCGHQVYPAANTIARKSTQPMKNWQIALQRVGREPNITVMELARELGVTWKTARRMKTQILDLTKT